MILDLLGLGVPPEYLMLCGVTRELIYFTFTELRLRLPAGFDTAGIPQYSSEFLQSLFESRKPMQPLDSVSSASRIEPQQAERTDKQTDVPSGSTLTAAAMPVSDSPSLLDIEQQRRRELLARKAVIASRKGKQPQTSALRTPSPQSTSPSADTPFKDVEMSSAEITPAATVDDFLNSIGPSQPTTVHKPSPPPTKSESDGMDIDVIPGLGGIWVSEEFDPPVAETAPVPTPTGTPPPLTLPPTTPNPIVSSTGPLSSGESTPSLLGDSITPQRLSAKRPVAADFVDAEKSQSHSYYPSFQNGQLSTHPSYTKRRQGGFASISSARRCVIDLSDSEDEEYPEDAPPQSRSFLPSRHALFHSHFAVNTSFTSMNTPPPTGVSSLSSVTLFEKELEIKRMREMIAQKEQMRLRKLVSMPPWCTSAILMTSQISARGTPMQSPTPSVPNVVTPEPAPSTPVLQEEDTSQPADDVMEDVVSTETRALSFSAFHPQPTC